ncbi:MAG: sigma-70 family RNA polymerase sigma factor [Cypionkella sp.]
MAGAQAKPAELSRADGEVFKAQLVGLLPHLRAFSRGLCGRPDQADDLVQETVMRAWTARASFVPGTNIKAWTFTIMRNHFLNFLRQQRRKDLIYAEGLEADLPVQANQEDGVHVNDLQAALNRLPDERREALLLVGAGGLSYDEAAAICGVAPGTMKSRVSRGRAQLALIIASEEQMDPADEGPSGK